MSDECSVRSAVCTWASRNTCLLVRLCSISEAHSDLDAQITYVSRLNQSVKEQIAELEKIKEEVDARFKVHKSFRDSTGSRFFHRTAQAREKFEVEALKAEQAYFAALGAQSKAQERRAKLESDHKEAVRALDPLEKAVEEYDSIRDELDQLYEKLFGGPTPGFPHEDEREEAYKAAKAENDATKERIRKSREAVRLLTVAQERLPEAQRYLEMAQKLAKEMWVFFDDTFNAVRLSNKKLTQILAAICDTNAQLSPEMLSTKETLVLQLEIAKLNTDTLQSRDVILSAITSAQDILVEAEPKVKELSEAVKQEERDALSDINRTAKVVEDARQELQLVRQEIFEKVAGFGKAAPIYTPCKPAPDYSTILDEGHAHEVGSQYGREDSSRNAVNGIDPPGYDNGEVASVSDHVEPLATESGIVV